MSAEGGGADWLERTDRDETEQPEKVIDALKLARDSVVADIGAGTGYFSLRIAKRLVAPGKVLATDLQPEMLRRLGDNAKAAGVNNVERILATPVDCKLPPGQVDLALMVDVYHELQDPEAMMAQIRGALKDRGRLVLVEYRAEDPNVPIRPEHKTTLRQMRYEIEPMGFRLTEVFEFLPHQHVEVFRKDRLQGEADVADRSQFPMVRRPGWSGTLRSEPYEQAGFRQLFNGTSLTGWIGDESAWQIQRETLRFADSGTTTLASKEQFSHYELDLQWRMRDDDAVAQIVVGSKAALRVRLENGTPWGPDYPENLAAGRLGEVTASGGQRLAPASDIARAIATPGDWNRLTLRREARRLAVAVNGLAAADVATASDESGPIAIEVLRGGIELRAIWCRPIE